ncbi:hypothetical protein CLOM_g17756 [Closterium sp. NIES-68]|nr:hypothetical protein CLOM_g17756 [Closterium sp. NIES-68]GJP62048.1 hypothetical protein CLOP_g19152 [Closterium sp. NIES-67]
MLLVSWLNSLRRCFGTPFLVLVFSIYWAQGFRAFPWTAISILVKDQLKLGPAAAQLMTSTAYMPWSVKPLYGILSDCVPIRGARRIPYIVIANALSLLSWLALAFVPRLAASPAPFTLLLVLQNVGAAMADVVIDAMVAEAAKGDKERYAGDLQSLSWFSMAAGGVVGSLLGGPALKTLRPHGMFALFAFFPLSQLAMCLVSSERKLLGGTGSEEEEQEEGEEGVEAEEGVEEEEQEGEEEEVEEGGGREKGGKEAGECLGLAGKANIGVKGAEETGFGDREKAVATAGEARQQEESFPTHSAITSQQQGDSKSEESIGLEEWEEVESDPQDRAGRERGTAHLTEAGSQAPLNDAAKETKSETHRNGGLGFGAGEEGGVKKRGAGSGEAEGRSVGLRQRRGGGGGQKETSEDGKGAGAEEQKRSQGGRRGRRAPGLWRKVVHVVMALWRAVMSPDIFWPMAWFMASCAVVPTLSSSLFYFHTNHLHLDPSFLGSTKVVGWAGLMLGTLLYNTRLKYVPIRRIFMWVHILMALCTIADTLLTSRLNLRLGIPDPVFLLGSAAVSDAVNQFKFMPFLVLSARLCPPGIEGTLFALFMSAYNFGNTLSGYMGATLATELGITATSFDNLTLGVTIQAFCTLLPIVFLRCVPANMTGVGDEGKQVVRVVKEQPEHGEDRKGEGTGSKRLKEA